MKKSKFSESQIVAILKEGEARNSHSADLAQTRDQPGHVLRLEIALRRCQRGGAEAGEGARGRERESQTRVCGVGAGKHGHQGRAEPKTLTPSAKREAVRIMVEQHKLSVS